MSDIIKIIQEEIMTTVANYPQFGDRLRSITEVGDGSSNAFQFRFENTSFNEVHYYFETPEYSYDVIIKLLDPYAGVWHLEFGVFDGEPEDETNENVHFEIMATLIQITKDFIDRFKPNALKFTPAKKNYDDKRRFNFYLAYMKRHMIDEYFVHEYGDDIIIERKVKIESNIPRI